MKQVRFIPWDTEKTTVCVTVEGAAVVDIYGIPFSSSVKNCTTVDHRCKSSQSDW